MAIGSYYPHLADIELENYKVRILDENKGTAAVTRVLIEASDGDDELGHRRRLREHHRGRWEALVDAIEYGMLRGRGYYGGPSARERHKERQR